jgi:hypothetical protein
MGYGLVYDSRVLSGSFESRRSVCDLDLRRRSAAITAYRTSGAGLGCLVRAGAFHRLRVLLDHYVITSFRSSVSYLAKNPIALRTSPAGARMNDSRRWRDNDK